MSLKYRSSNAKNPTGFWGKVAAHLMTIWHWPVYKAVAASLDINSKDDLLDIGCGTGIFIIKFAAQTHRVAGLDHSQDMIGLASRYNRKRVQRGTAEFKLGEVERIPWGDQRFSAVSLIETFYSVKPLRALKEIYRVLRPGGRVAVGLGLNLYSETQMRSWLEQAGFSNISFSFSKGLGMPRIMVARAVRAL